MLSGPDGESFDLVVLDLVMPDLDGMGVLGRLRDIGRAIPVIVQTAHGSIETVISAMRAGASDFVVKPVGAERLAVSIKNALRTEALEGEIRRISRHRNVPKSIHKATIAKRGANPHHVCSDCLLTPAAVIKEAADKRLSNKRAHSKPGSVPFVAERKKKVLRTEA